MHCPVVRVPTGAAEITRQVETFDIVRTRKFIFNKRKTTYEISLHISFVNTKKQRVHMAYQIHYVEEDEGADVSCTDDGVEQKTGTNY